MKQNILHILNFYLRFFLFQSKRLFLLLLVGTPLLLSAATTSVTNATPSAITDNSCFDRTFIVPIGPATINDITISVDLVHTYRGALHLYLTSPASTQIELITYQANNSATNLHVLFSDAGTTSILSDTSNHTSIVTRTPATALSTFDTENPQGTWTLRVCDDDAFGDTGTFNTATLNIDYTLDNVPPTADSGTDQTAPFGTNITLNGIGSDTDGTISSYLWQEGAITLSNSANFSKNDFTVGAHTLTFTVTDDDGATDTDTVVITITNTPPTANAGADQTAYLGNNITLDGSASSDSDGTITTYIWTEGATTLGSGETLTLSSLADGTHTITLTVTDNAGGTSTDTVTITIVTPLPCTTETPDNLIANSCVEQSSTGWSPYRGGLGGWVNNEGHSGIHSLKIQNDIVQNSGWRYLTIPVNNRRTITFGGWNKAENVANNALNALDFRVEFTDGTYVWFVPSELRFSKGTHDWEQVEITKTFDKDVANVRPYALLYYGTGTAWFDDIYVIPVDATPTAYPQSVNTNENVALDIVLEGNDSDGDTVTFHIDTPPTNGTLSVISGNVLTYTPNTDYSGDDSFTFVVRDGTPNTSIPATINIHINGAPTAVAESNQTVLPGESITLDGSGSSDDVGVVSYQWTESTIPLNLTGIAPTFTIAVAGTYTITLTVTDAEGLTDTDTLTIIVNTPPVAEDINLTIIEDTNVTFALHATDADGDSIISYSIVSSPSHGTLSGSDTNLTYIPNIGYTGTDFFTYQAYDGIDFSNTATVTITVVPKPRAVHDDFNTTYLTPLSGNLLTNDIGANNTLTDWNTTRDDNLTSICNLTQDFSGSLNISSDGDFVYFPEDRFAGNVGFYYTITGDLNYTSSTSVCITVYPPNNDLSIVKNAPSTVDGGDPMDYTLTISSDLNATYIPALDVIVADTLPIGVIYNGVTASNAWVCSEVGGTVSCAASPILPGFTETITIHAFAPNNLTTLTNTATIDSSTPDPDRSNNSSTAVTNVEGADVDLAITKTVTPTTATVTTSQAFSYNLTVSNQGSASTSNVSIRDDMNTSLAFISVNSGADWVCSQGSTINCTYTANGGVFPANTTSNTIVINVRAPNTTATISNTATVSSNALEVDTTNNSSDVNVTVQDGSNFNNQEVPLSKYLQYNIYGDYEMIGNANINFSGTDPNQNYNDDVYMTYVDAAGTGSTYNSSSSALNVDNNNTILWAGLYWSGHICQGPNNAGQLWNNGCHWENSSYSNFTQGRQDIGQIQFRTPAQGYQVITANTLNVINDPNGLVSTFAQVTSDLTYSAFADVTELVKAGGSGAYSVADIVLTEGSMSFGNYGGWTMVTIYEDPSNTLSYKNISVFNGFQYIDQNNEPLDVSGFLTPRSGPVTASLAFFGADGDPALNGVIRMQNTDGDFQALSNSANPVNNTLNSTMTVFGNPINAGVTKTYGIDADRIDVSTFMSRSQTSTSFRFDATPGANQDVYSLSMFAFATDLTSPIIDGFEKSAVLIKKDGTRRVSAPNERIYPGSKIEYTIRFTNIGDEVAEEVTIFDDFDYDKLTLALDVNHFDATKLKLFDGNNTTNEINNPNCGYDIGQRRVSCKLASVAIGASYTMQFVVSVKEQLTSSDFNTSAVNTAYAKYRNPNDNTFINRGTTPAPESEPIGGKSNSLNAGQFADYPSSTEKYIRIKAINEFFDYTQDRNITTKLVNSPFNIQLIHLDKNGSNTGYVTYSDANGNRRPLNVLLSLGADTNQAPITNNNGAIVMTTFDINDRSMMSRGLEIPRAYHDTRLRMNYLDWHTILGWAKSNSPCLTQGASAVFLNGLPSCFSVYYYVKDLMPKASFSAVANCYGEGNRTIVSGEFAPCDIRAYDLSGNPSRSIDPRRYQHSYGCFQCVSDGSNHFQSFSIDNFVVRPVAFDLNNTTSGHYPDLLRAGSPYGLSLTAIDGRGDPTLDYNVTDANHILRTGDTNKYLKDGTLASVGILADTDANVSQTRDYNISDGVSTTDTILNTPEDVVDIFYDEVGMVGINITDPSWANIDMDDTPLECNATQNPRGVAIETGRTICSNELNLTFIPHHFNVTATLQNHRDGDFTYLSNEETFMSARITTTITAQNEQNGTTSNFKRSQYENPMIVDVNVTDWNTTLTSNLATLKPQRYNGTQRLDTDISITDLNRTGAVPVLLGFGTDSENNGTHTIDTMDTNTSQRLFFNYRRDINTPKNPFVIDGNETNISVQSTYTSTRRAGDVTAIIKGTVVADRDATFYYARVRPSLEFYPDITEDEHKTPIHIDIYCDLGFATCQNPPININTLAARTDEPYWWLSLGHDTGLNDGNVTLTSPSASITPNTATITLATDQNIEVSPTSATRPVTIPVTLNTNLPTDTSLWLIYNPSDPILAPNPFYEVEFIGGAGWAGHGDTGHVVGGNVNNQKNKKLEW